MADRNRFLELSESELTSLLDQKNSDNTKKATKVALNVFRDYLKGRKIDEDSLVALTDELKRGNFMQKPEKRTAYCFPQKTESRLSHDKTILLLNSCRSIICLSLQLRQIIDLLASDKSRYFAQN